MDAERDAADPSRLRARSWVAIGCAIVLVAVSIWEIIVTRRAATSVPGDDAWAQAAQLVRRGHQRGDLIVFAPAWVDPVGRMHLGDLIPIEMAARMDDARYARVWELSIRDAHRDERPAFEQHVDGVLVRRYDRTPAVVLAEVEAAKLRVDGAPVRGPSRELAEVGFEPHRCILVVPAPNRPVRMTVALPAGTLVGYAGLADVFTRRDIRAPATLAVEVGGKRLATISPGVEDGWVRFETPIPAGDVTFVARAAAPNRLLCFAAEVRR